MPLSTLFNDSDVEYVREICRIPNTADRVSILVGKLDVLNSAQVIAVQRDVEQWKRIEYGTEKSKGGIKGTDYSTDRNRDYITNKMRERLDYPPLPGIADTKDGLGILSIGLPSFGG
jgi:hypothetical protein